MGQRSMSWSICRQGRTAARRYLCHRPVIPPLEGRDRLLTVVSIELHGRSPRDLEGRPWGFEVHPLNDSIRRLSEGFRSFWHAQPFVGLRLPAIGMSIALEIGKADSIKVNVVFGHLSGRNEHDRFLKLSFVAFGRGAPQNLAPYRNSVRIHGPVFVRPVAPCRRRRRVCNSVTLYLGQRISPVNDRSGRRALKNAHMRITHLFV